MSEQTPENLTAEQRRLNERLWDGEYWEDGQPIVAKLGEIIIRRAREGNDGET